MDELDDKRLKRRRRHWLIAAILLAMAVACLIPLAYRGYRQQQIVNELNRNAGYYYFEHESVFGKSWENIVGEDWQFTFCHRISIRADGYRDDSDMKLIAELINSLFHRSGARPEAKLNIAFMDDSHLEILAGCPHLISLKTWRGNISDKGLEHVRTLAGLQALGLNQTQVTDAGLVHLQFLPELHTLALESGGITDAGMPHLKPLKNLRVLSLELTSVTDAGVAQLKDLPKLSSLTIDCPRISMAGLAHLDKLPNLNRLELGWPGLTDDLISQFKLKHPQITVLTTDSTDNFFSTFWNQP